MKQQSKLMKQTIDEIRQRLMNFELMNFELLKENKEFWFQLPGTWYITKLTINWILLKKKQKIFTWVVHDDAVLVRLIHYGVDLIIKQKVFEGDLSRA